MFRHFRSGVARSLRWAVLIGVSLACSSPALSQDAPGDATKSAGASPAVARILQAWKAREDRTKTLHCVWDSREVPNGKPGQRRAVAVSHCECWIGRDGQYRFQMTTERSPGAKGAKERKHESTASDGRAYSSLNWVEGSKLPRRGKIFDFGPRRVGYLNREMTPLIWVYRPSSLFTLSPEKFHFVTGDAIVDGLRYTKLRGSGTRGWPAGLFWFDPRQDDTLVLWDLNGSGTSALRYQIDKANGPTLAGWTAPQDDGSLVIAKVKAFEIYKELPAETFQIPFPPGTAVAVDLAGSTHEAYIVKPDGTRRTIFNLNPFSPRVRKILMQTVDFTIEPEPLLDAIDFMHQRYQIAIAMDAASFRAAKIDPSIEVQQDTSGIRVWEALTWLSAQCSRPFGIFEEKGGLLLKPL